MSIPFTPLPVNHFRFVGRNDISLTLQVGFSEDPQDTLPKTNKIAPWKEAEPQNGNDPTSNHPSFDCAIRLRVRMVTGPVLKALPERRRTWQKETVGSTLEWRAVILKKYVLEETPCDYQDRFILVWFDLSLSVLSSSMFMMCVSEETQCDLHDSISITSWIYFEEAIYNDLTWAEPLKVRMEKLLLDGGIPPKMRRAIINGSIKLYSRFLVLQIRNLPMSMH